MSAVKVVLKFLDWITDVEAVRNYSKKLSNSITSVMMSQPEIQYVLLRSLHAVVQKRPYLLDKDYKYFFIQYTDPIYVKLEKIDILYRLTDNKNCDGIIGELKSYAIMEYDTELVKRVIRYIGFISFKFEKSMEICVEAMKEILEHNLDFTLSEGIIVARDIMRRYKGKSLELLKKIDDDFIRQVQDPDAKAALLYIIGEFCVYIKNSVEMIQPFVESISEETPNVKLQILNCVIKNYVNKPDETEEMVKICLQKCSEETENPDVRDRAYIYWRLLETEPDIAKEMLTCDKPSFEFQDENGLDNALVDNIIENMTNMSAICHKLNSDLILKEEMIGVEEQEVKEENEKPEIKEKNEKKSVVQANNDADLLGLDEDGPSAIPQIQDNQGGAFNIMDFLGGSMGSKTLQSNPVPNFEDFGFVYNTETEEKNIKIFNDSGVSLSQLNHLVNSQSLSVYAQFHRENGKMQLGFHVLNKTNQNIDNINFVLNSNSFGLSIKQGNYQTISPNSSELIICEIEIDASKHDKKPPSCPYKIDLKIITTVETSIVQISILLNSLLVENGRMASNDFVTFFKQNNNNLFNQQFNISFIEEETITKLLERNNIFLVAKQNKQDLMLYFSCKEVNGIPSIVECVVQKGQNTLKIRLISAVEPIVPLLRELLEYILNKK
jgi:hypothetical protein